MRRTVPCSIKRLLQYISSVSLIFTLSVFIYCTMVSIEEWNAQAPLFGSFLLAAIFFKIVSLFLNYLYRGEEENDLQLNWIREWRATVFLTILVSVILLSWGNNFLVPSGITVKKLPYNFFILPISISIILPLRFSIKWPPFSSKPDTFTLPGIFLLLSLVYVELQTLGQGRLNLISSIWRYNPGSSSFRYLIIAIFAVITAFILGMIYKGLKKQNAIINLLTRKKTLFTALFMLIALSFFVFMRKRVTLGEDWDFILQSVGGGVYYKYPLVYLLSQWNFSLFSNWLCPDTAYRGLCFLAGFVIFIQIFRLWKLLWPEDKMRCLIGWLLTVIPFGTAQFFFGYSGRKTIELAFLSLLIYYAVFLIKNRKKFFLVGLLTAFTFCSHNVHILTFPAIILACCLSIFGESWRKKVVSSAKCMFGFLTGYVMVYGIVGHLQRILLILFNRGAPSVQEELLWKLTFPEIFSPTHICLLTDNINSYGSTGLLLIFAMWLARSKKVFIGNKKIAIFLGVLTISCLFWVPWKKIFPLWYNFDQFVAPFMILNIFAAYLWLATSRNLKEFILPAAILIAVFGSYSLGLISFMHFHRNEVNFSFKSKPQAVLSDKWIFADRLEFGNYTSEEKHNFKIEGSKNDWANFFRMKPLERSSIFPSLLKPYNVIPVLFFYENFEAVADEGRLCSGSIEFQLKAKKNSRHLLLWRTTSSNDKNIKNPPVEVIVNGERLGLWEMHTPVNILPVRKLNDFVWRKYPYPFRYGIWQNWQEFNYEIPAKFVKDGKIHFKIFPKNGTMQLYHLWLYSETPG